MGNLLRSLRDFTKQSKKQKLSTDFFKPKEKSVPLKSEEIITTAIPLQKVNYVGDCPLFSRCEPGVCYDIGLVVGALNQITENEKYQILTDRNYNFLEVFSKYRWSLLRSVFQLYTIEKIPQST